MKRTETAFPTRAMLAPFLLSLMLLFSGCEKEAITPDASSKTDSEFIMKGAKAYNEMITLEGRVDYTYYSQKEHRIIAENHLLCSAEYTPDGKHHFALTTNESFPDGTPYRIATFEGHVSSAGQLTYCWPETWTDGGMEMTDVVGTIYAHTGLVLKGPGVAQGTLKFKGSFIDGEFKASVHLTAMHEALGLFPPFTEEIDGPVKMTISYNMAAL